MGKVRSCSFCGESVVGMQKSAIYCSGACRVAAHRRLMPCDRCSLSHPTVTEISKTCAPCHLHDMIVREQTALKDIIAMCDETRSCFYCGELGTEKEHVIPRRFDVETWIVKSCKECNTMAGGEPFASVVDKLKYIRERRAKRYSKLLKMPEWDASELKEMGLNLRKSIAAYQRARDIVRTQLSWEPLPIIEGSK